MSLNSILLCDLFRAIHQWRIIGQQDVSEKDWLRIILPISLRGFKDRKSAIANRTSLVQIDRRELGSTSREALASSIDREITLIRRWKLDRIFLIFVRLMSLFESNLRKAAKNRKSRGVAVFTNLGRPLRKMERFPADESEPLNRLLEFDFVGPIRYGTPLNFSVARFRKSLRITLHYDASIVQRGDARELLRTYVRHLTEDCKDGEST